MTVRWSIAEAVTWIAFGDAQPIGNWGKFTTPSREWPVQPTDGLLAPLEALAHGATTGDGFDPEHWRHAKSLTLRDKPDILLRDLRADMAKEKVVGEKLDAAGKTLARAVLGRRLHIYAAPAEQPFARREKVDPDLFARFRLPLHLDGRIAPARPGSRYQGPMFVDAAFEPEEVRELWPPAPPQDVREWMMAEAHACVDHNRDHKPGKRDDLIKRCVEATECTHRQAMAAYEALPPHLRRSRGKQRQRRS